MSKAKLISILKGAIIALSGGGTTALIAYLSGLDAGQIGIWGTVVMSVIINALRKYMEKDPVVKLPMVHIHE